MYNIKKTGTKPARYQVFYGNCPFSRPMSKHDAETLLEVYNGNLASIGASFQQPQTRINNIKREENVK